MNEHPDVVIVGGGPAGAICGCLLAQSGFSVLLVERDIHPREHPGESLTPSINLIFRKIGFLPAVETAGFIHKSGAYWSSPRAPHRKAVALRLADFPLPGADRPYAYNVERDIFDAMLLRHAYDNGVAVLQGAAVTRVEFLAGRAVGVDLRLPDGFVRHVPTHFVVDASGRRGLIGTQLRLRRNDPELRQFAAYSWFSGVGPQPPGLEGYLGLHFLGLQQAWAWQIPLRNGIQSIGVVAHRRDFVARDRPPEDVFGSLVARNVGLAADLAGATSVRPWRIEGDYSYSMTEVAGPGWLMVGDALGFVDPIFSNGLDVAVHCASFGADAVDRILRGADEQEAMADYRVRATAGLTTWRELTRLFYELQNLFTSFAVRRRYREDLVRVLQGNLHTVENLNRAQALIRRMRAAQEAIMSDPEHLLRPGAFDAIRTGGAASE